MLRRLFPLAGLLLLTACDAGAPVGHPDATVPTPTWAPPASAPPAGSISAVPSKPAGVALDAGGARLAVISDKSALVLHEPATGLAEIPAAEPPRGVVAVAGGGFRAVAGAAVLDLPPSATAPASWPLPAPGGAIAVPRAADWTAVALPDRGDVIILSSAGTEIRTMHTGGRPSALAADDERIAVLDAGQSSLTVYDAATGARQEALRAGDGAVAVAAVGAPGGRSRFAVIDARDGELLVFDTGPLLLRQRYPVPGGAWALAYDPGRRVLWVTATQRNEVVGFDLSGGTPREVARHATVRLPVAVAVDPSTGALAVGGSDATGAEGLVQRIPA
ncbi:YncE family protein [Dactylosporangium sp. NPDC048998]|uniref:YncE family protein n=1 Tax=Dactylosporangium sp. NPDC048998 TaxID=3363976 RepID=UPI003717CFD8